MRVLVTGGAGYIGSHTVAELLAQGHDVTVVDDLSAGHAESLPLSRCRFVHADISSRATEEALAEQDVVIHFAGLLSVAASMRDPHAYFQSNVVKGLALLDAMERASVRRIVFSSTCATYGLPEGPLDESHSQKPVNTYGVSKLMFEQVLSAYGRIRRVHAIALRYFNAAGARMDGSLGEDHAGEEHLVPLAIDAALGRSNGLTIFGSDYDTPDGTCVRDYIHVDDLARAHVAAAERIEAVAGPTGFCAINLGTGVGSTVREVVREVEASLGKSVPHTIGPRRAGDPPSLVAVPRLAQERLGFSASATLRDIVRSAARWREAHPHGYRTP